jgi:hypothetical protein
MMTKMYQTIFSAFTNYFIGRSASPIFTSPGRIEDTYSNTQERQKAFERK